MSPSMKPTSRTHGRLVNVHTREVHEGVDVAVKGGRVAMFGVIVSSPVVEIGAGDALPGHGGFALGLHPSEARVVVG